MKKLVFLLLIILLWQLGCQKQELQGRKLAQVGKDILFEEDFKASIGEDLYASLSPEDKRKYIEQWVNLSLLAQASAQDDLDKEKAVLQRIDYAAKKIKANALIGSRLAELKISEDDLFAYYRLHMGEFQKPLMEYKVQRIYVKDQARAERIKTEILGGLSFDSAVSIFSQEALRDKGGYMGFVSNSGADSVFWNMARNLKKGEVGVFSYDDGWYLIRQYEERYSDGESGFELFRDEIRKRILNERRQQVYEDLLLELKKSEKDIYYY